MLIGYLIRRICLAWEGILTETIIEIQLGLIQIVYLRQTRMFQILLSIQTQQNQRNLTLHVAVSAGRWHLPNSIREHIKERPHTRRYKSVIKLLRAEIFFHLRPYLFFCDRNRFTHRRSSTMLHFSNLIVIEIVLVIEQETPPLYLWKSGNGTVEQFGAFLLNNQLVNTFRRNPCPFVKGFIGKLK